MSTIDIIDRQINRLLVERDALVEREGRFPDEHADGSVLVWTKRFDPCGPAYTFAAIRAGGLWYVTGKWQVGMLWPAFVEKFLADAEQVWVVTEMEEM